MCGVSTIYFYFSLYNYFEFKLNFLKQIFCSNGPWTASIIQIRTNDL